MAFGRRVQATGRDDAYRRQPPHIRRLIDAMQIIFDDASAIAEAIRQRRPFAPAVDRLDIHSPIRSKDSEKLFEHKNEAGETQYTTYCFTKNFDLKSANAEAQFKLFDLYTRVIFANLFINQHTGGHIADNPKVGQLTSAIDEILAKASYFISFFRSYARTTDILMLRLDKAGLENATREHAEDWHKRMQEAKRLMFRPEDLTELVPNPYPCFVIAASGPYCEGQMVFNGVYFPPTEAATLREKLGRLQADAIGDQMRARRA
jgi:hypothetical protein